MKVNALSLVVLGALAMGVATAVHAEVSFNLSTVSLYKSRGVDQDSSRDAVRPALQGGLDYTSASGFYLGNWNSTVHFGGAEVEMDLYGGYRLPLSSGLTLDLGYIQYVYPNVGALNSGEVYAGAAYRGLEFKVYRGTRHEVNDGDLYYVAGYTLPLVEHLDLKLGLGYQTYQVEDLHSKTDYSVGLSYALGKHFTVSGMLAGADRRGDVGDGSRDARFIVGAGMAF